MVDSGTITVNEGTYYVADDEFVPGTGSSAPDAPPARVIDRTNSTGQNADIELALAKKIVKAIDRDVVVLSDSYDLPSIHVDLTGLSMKEMWELNEQIRDELPSGKYTLFVGNLDANDMLPPTNSNCPGATTLKYYRAADANAVGHIQDDFCK